MDAANKGRQTGFEPSLIIYGSIGEMVVLCVCWITRGDRVSNILIIVYFSPFTAGSRPSSVFEDLGYSLMANDEKKSTL